MLGFRHKALLASLVFAPMLSSCGKVTNPSSSLAATEEDIRKIELERAEALRAGDVIALGKLYSDDFVMITSAGEIRTKQDQLRDISSGVVRHQPGESKILRIHVYGDVAVVQSEARGELVINGVADNVTRRYTRVYVKNNGVWQLTATHMSRVSMP